MVSMKRQSTAKGKAFAKKRSSPDSSRRRVDRDDNFIFFFFFLHLFLFFFLRTIPNRYILLNLSRTIPFSLNSQSKIPGET